MNILFDLVHSADVNLFKNSIYALSKNGENVIISYRERGKLSLIAKAELPDFKLNKIGEHKTKIVGKIISLIKREISAYIFLKKNKVEIIVTQGLTCGIACKLLGVKILHYDDDIEYKTTYLIGKWLSDIDLMPDFMPAKGKNIVKHFGYKELAYLHPKYFKPNEFSLKAYNITAYNYIFIREISNISLNYKNKESLLPKIVKYISSLNIKILLSIEDKNLTNLYSDNCIILKEPIVDIYSLIYFSSIVISSGDTVARESCLTGTPCIYTGDREMLANNKLVEIGLMTKTTSLNEIIKTINYEINSTHRIKKRNEILKLITNHFDDTNEVLMHQIDILSKHK
ncbi:MAG: DUF354 domain-containing protein [Bacteroidota bacterium]